MTKKRDKVASATDTDQRYSALGYRGPGRFEKIQLVSATLTAKNKLKVKYSEQNDLGVQEHQVKLDHVCHEDLVRAFDAFGYDALNLCEQPEATHSGIENFTYPEGLAVYHVNFSDKTISGEKLSSKVSAGTVALSSPRVDDTYERYEEFDQLLRDLDLEVKCYLNGKQRAEQSDLFAGQEDKNNEEEEE